VSGDDTRDIFDGLAVAMSALGRPRYVTAEQVAEITEGAVRLSLTHQQVETLGEYVEPATSARIQADSKSGFADRVVADVREVEADVVAPIKRREQSMNPLRRVYFLFRRLLRR